MVAAHRAHRAARCHRHRLRRLRRNAHLQAAIQGIQPSGRHPHLLPEPGPSDAIIYPGDGPFDKRLGYSALGEFLPRLLKRDYLISQQVRFSPALMNYVEHGLFVPYVEKIQAGLSITDCRGQDLYHYNYPQHLYPDFASIPPVIVKSLLFIENRDLLDPQDPRNNPAVDWPRFAKAAYSQVAKYLALPGQSAGGSTLATQLEKYRHSPTA